MAEVDIVVKSVEGRRLTQESKEDSKATFDVHVSLVETERNPDSMSIKFTMEMETRPAIAKLSIAGSATIRGSDEDIQALTIAKDESGVPPLFMKVYQKIYATMYLLCGSLKIPYPAPGLLKSTKVSTSREMPQPLQTEGNPSLANQ